MSEFVNILVVLVKISQFKGQILRFSDKLQFFKVKNVLFMSQIWVLGQNFPVFKLKFSL